ncbi:DUF1287 domain-containing protein [Rubritalea profundi]|uniref:DUF1287 domain-containing protein n=1 Tax=Rubritalea profundi TaxID=1658618 RepID=A0A2S7U0Y7_9BACT|nr:DUF1287 domain-containing protein [Rubritalea profundi]PQJ28666.1 hypothetical protein BSZ32_09230 [Rubritalea profundi]
MLRLHNALIVIFCLASCSVHPSDFTREQRKTIAATRWQIGKTTSYNPSYQRLKYPKGDVPIEGGVCTDVIIRTLRKGHKIDLQKEIHEDMAAHFELYPPLWGLTTPDYNIDHRRVPNIQTYLSRMGWNLPIDQIKTNYQPDDIITCAIGGVTPHIMIVSDRKGISGHWALIHNVAIGVIENDVLFNEKITAPLTGHCRISNKPL